MTREELRNHKEYTLCFNKIRAYKKGFEFTVNYAAIPTPQANALRIVLRDATEYGLIEPIATDLSIDLKETAVTYRKLKARNI